MMGGHSCLMRQSSASTIAFKFCRGFFTLVVNLSVIWTQPCLISSNPCFSLPFLGDCGSLPTPTPSYSRLAITNNNSIIMQSSLLKRLLFRSSFVAKMSENLKRAARVQENIQANNYKIQHEARIRQKVTVQSSIEALENEMREEIARALKNSESKVIYLIKKAEQRWKEVQGVALTPEQKQEYNNLITLCEKARWEFMVHRQAVGFTIRNYQMVTTIYKIPPMLPLEGQ